MFENAENPSTAKSEEFSYEFHAIFLFLFTKKRQLKPQKEEYIYMS